MATSTATPKLDAQRQALIASALHQACAPITEAHKITTDAKDALDGVRDGEMGIREGIMAQVAQLSIQGNWTKAELKAATKAAIGQINDKDNKTLATFISEVRRAGLPGAREHFAALLDLRDKAWDAETEQKNLDNTAPTPIRKAWARKYHFLLTGLLGAAEDGLILTTVDECVAYARDNDPAHNLDKIFAKIEAARKALADIYVDFPADDLGHVVDTLTNLDKKVLEVARGRRLRDLEVEVGALRLDPISPNAQATAPITPATVVAVVSSPFVGHATQPATTPVTTPTVVNNNSNTVGEVAEGAIELDIYTDVLGEDLVGLKAA